MAKKNNKKIGAVLVQGGGIAGVQASLDLANSGFKVYLVERSGAIGGMMAHLDKTFPTGDCATCIVSPKLVECDRNLNVEILTLSEMVDLQGQPGNFKATIRRRPRYIDMDKCTSCGDCSGVCPVDISNHFDRSLGSRKAVAKHYAQAVPNVFGILKNGHAPCKTSCPAGINVQGYIQLIKKKEYLKAVELIRERNPLSAICGRVCTHPCEAACTRGDVDSPVAIRLLKRFASDKEMEMIESGEISLPKERTAPADAKKVAVVGAGPSGLSAADDLAGRGFAVTVYETLAEAGGMLRWGIPEYRLPRKVLDFEIELIRRKGVNFVLNCCVGKDISVEKVQAEHDAVFVGVGAQQSRPLGINGEDLDGVMQGLDFLRLSKMPDSKPEIKGKVVVIGGGDVAMDAACTAIRSLPESVTILYRRSAEEMPASAEEIHHATVEGVKFHYLTAPVEFLGDASGRIRAVKCIRMVLGEPDESGRRRPMPVEGSEFEVAADRAIIAVGNVPDPHITKNVAELDMCDRGRMPIDEHAHTTSEGIFAGGDFVTGAATVIEAVAAGKRAAESIAAYLSSGEMPESRFEDTVKPIPDELLPSPSGVEKKPRAKSEELSAAQRAGNFNEVETGCSEEAALAETERCLNCALCSECGECSLACEPGAIDYSMQDETIELDVGSVILTPGFEEFAAEAKGEFGFGRYKNVVTSVQFERMLSAAGPFEGHVIRLSDNRPAKRIAWIQCVGSRDSSCGNEYCSSICCMASIKQAMVAGDHVDDMEATVFYMDIRAHGKDFDQFYERARADESINFIKSIPSRVVQVPGSNDVRLRFVNEKGGLEEKDFDLLVLGVGMEPSQSIMDCAEKLGLDLNEYGFCATDRLNPMETSRSGVFVAGAFQEPKDIPETVTQASGAASMAMELLAEGRNSLVSKKTYPDEHDITDEEPRIGVFVCHCGINIASVVDVKKVVEVIENEPDVVFATDSMFTCSDTSLSDIRKIIHEHGLNRIVVGSCTPRTHEPLFRETLREAGLNPYLFELSNIRDQCSWVHSSEPEKATEKAIELVKMSVSRARLLEPLEGSTLAVDQAGLVIGGGLTGMTAALALADQGFKVNLIEKADALGGHLLEIHNTLEHADISDFTAGLVKRVSDHGNITVHLNAEIDSVKGHIGKFSTTFGSNGQSQEVTSGTIIVATGGLEAETSEFMRGKNDNVITQIELEKALHEKTFSGAGKNIVMVQCVGSRNEEHAYCSRICCSMAIKNALAIKAQSPDANVYVLYRDIRTYGFREIYYKKARQAGVVFIRYGRDNPPVVSGGSGGLAVSIESPDFPEAIKIEADNVVLSTGVENLIGNKDLSNMLKVPLNADGFYVEAHLKLRPVEFATEGVYLCGLAHSPKFIDENIAQARAAASRAATVLSKTHLDVSAQVSYVDQDKCISCMTCLKVCPYTAPACNVNGKAQIEAAKCMGCGICSAECPAKAIQLHHFESDQFKVMINELLEKNLVQELKK